MRNLRWDEFLLEATDEVEMQIDKAWLKHKNRVKKRKNDFAKIPHRRRSTFWSQFAGSPEGT